MRRALIAAVGIILGIYLSWLVPGSALAEPRLDPYPKLAGTESLEIMHRWADGTMLETTVTLRATNEEAKNITFAYQDAIDKSGRRIPGSQIQLEGEKTNVPANRVESYKLTVKEIPGPGTYPIVIYLQPAGRSEPQELKITLKVLAPAEIETQATVKPEVLAGRPGKYLAFTLKAGDQKLTNLRFAASLPTVQAAASGQEKPTVYPVTVLAKDGAPAPAAIEPNQTLELLLPITPPTSGKRTLLLQVKADELATAVEQPLVVNDPIVKFDPAPQAYAITYDQEIPLFAPLLNGLKGFLGLGVANPCSNAPLTFRSEPQSESATADLTFQLFTDGERKRNLTNVAFTLWDVRNGGCQALAAPTVTGGSEAGKTYTLAMRPKGFILPGSYTGQVRLPSGETAQVTVHVRQGIWAPILAALLGYFAQGLIPLYYRLEERKHLLVRLDGLIQRLKLKKQIDKQQTPLFIERLVD